jgi:hypothetical protein
MAEILQPNALVYVIGAKPAAVPLTTPLTEPMEATDKFPLDQLPPAVGSVSGLEVPGHKVNTPVIAAGRGLTVTPAVI